MNGQRRPRQRAAQEKGWTADTDSSAPRRHEAPTPVVSAVVSSPVYRRLTTWIPAGENEANVTVPLSLFLELVRDADLWRLLQRQIPDGMPIPGALNSLRYRRAAALKPRPGDFRGVGKGRQT
jgi:hypothetical protein